MAIGRYSKWSFRAIPLLLRVTLPAAATRANSSAAAAEASLAGILHNSSLAFEENDITASGVLK